MTGANKTVGHFNSTTDPLTGTQKRPERTRMKAETVCHNDAFLETLKARESASPRNIWAVNQELLKSLSQGRPLKPRMTIPEGVEVFMYGN
jgi:hypothetical protein